MIAIMKYATIFVLLRSHFLLLPLLFFSNNYSILQRCTQYYAILHDLLIMLSINTGT